MQNTKTVVNCALAGVLAMGVLGLSQQAAAAEKKAEGEKCYGITKAAKNDCQTAASACAGSSKEDGNPSAFIYVPKGTCEKIVGGSLQPKA